MDVLAEEQQGGQSRWCGVSRVDEWKRGQWGRGERLVEKIIMQDWAGRCKDFSFYSEGNMEARQGSNKQRRSMIWLRREKVCSGYCVKNRLVSKKRNLWEDYCSKHVRGNSASYQGHGEKQLNSGYVLKIASTRFPDGLLVSYKRKKGVKKYHTFGGLKTVEKITCYHTWWLEGYITFQFGTIFFWLCLFYENKTIR